jgi:hypothetical protein
LRRTLGIGIGGGRGGYRALGIGAIGNGLVGANRMMRDRMLRRVELRGGSGSGRGSAPMNVTINK